MDSLRLLNKSFGTYYVKGLYIEPTYWQAAAIVFLLFLLVLTLARLRHLYVHWALGKAYVSALFWGFLLAVILEGFLMLGGRTLFTEIIGWKAAPKPISTILEIGRAKLVDVLGAQDEISSSGKNEKPSYQQFVTSFEELDESDKVSVKSFICKP